MSNFLWRQYATANAGCLAAATLVALATPSPCSATAPVESLLYQFAGGASGATPTGALTIDPDGNLYGAAGGGANGCGVIFKVTPNGTESVLYAFKCGADGTYPQSTLIRSSTGVLYGTTFEGGAPCPGTSTGCGTVFQIDKRGVETVLYAFTGQADGNQPSGSLVRDKSGNLYGTTEGGPQPSGGLFKISRIGGDNSKYTFSVLTPFSIGAITLDPAGNIYGLTPSGGSYDQGGLYKFSASGDLSLIYSFAGGNDGGFPSAAPTLDSDGNVFGVTSQGGSANRGTIFKINPAGNITTLHLFDQADGANPAGAVLKGPSGTIFGTAYYGGGYADGTAYALASNGTMTVRYSFGTLSNRDGRYPIGKLVRDKAGNFYGVTAQGGSGSGIGCTAGCGTVFKLTK